MLAQHDLSAYLTTAKNNTISTPDLHREEGGRENAARAEGREKEKVEMTG